MKSCGKQKGVQPRFKRGESRSGPCSFLGVCSRYMWRITTELLSVQFFVVVFLPRSVPDDLKKKTAGM